MQLLFVDHISSELCAMSKWWVCVWRSCSMWQVEYSVDDEGGRCCGVGCDGGGSQCPRVWHVGKTQRQVAVDASIQLRTWPRTLRRGHLESVSTRTYCTGTAASAFITVRLHVMQRTVLPRPFCLSVCLSVCLSNACIDKTKETCATFLYHMKDHSS